jgi:hypothetical protein
MILELERLYAMGIRERPTAPDRRGSKDILNG